ncbi:hypothetical protein EMPG_15149 [Blastomyces silverae]|uniref:Uncharacterized protein n=1 Tax=Blastomyces silverae TaxID=2060906 RepID=A0A0H1BDB8_9EURO|nr:hypothetical protein EMPG_15149 [Blastomyces silverae]
MLSKLRHRFPKAKMSSKETSCESWRPLTEHSEMTRTKLARTAVKLVIANMTVPSNVTSPLALFAVSVEMLDTWPKIVRTAREGLIGVIMALLFNLAVVVAVMPWTVRWSNSCKNSAAHRQAMTNLSVASRLALAAMNKMTITPEANVR